MEARSAPRPLQRTPDASVWEVDGQPLEDATLRERLTAALQAAAADVPALVPPEPRDVLAFDSAETVLEQASLRLEDSIDAESSAARLRVLVRHARAVSALALELGNARLAHRSRAFGRVQESLARLRETTAIDQILQAIPREVVRIGFPRVILSRVRDSYWVPEVCIIDGDPDWAAEIVRVGAEDPQLLDHMILETEMVRRRAPMLVRDVQNDPRTHRPIADASFSRSYVAAPLMPEGRVIGFLHADCYTARRDVDEFDRDLLWMFAEGAGYAFERTVLLERLRDLRERVLGLTGSIGEVMDDVVDAEVELARIDRETAAVTRSAATSLMVDDARLQSVLTRREVEIAKLVAAGHTNGEIARRLCLSEGTIKSHVSSILRKLRATNRAQAASIVMRLSRPGGTER